MKTPNVPLSPIGDFRHRFAEMGWGQPADGSSKSPAELSLCLPSSGDKGQQGHSPVGCTHLVPCPLNAAHQAPLRPYQQEAVQAVLEAFTAHRSALVVMPTGTGKTVVFARVAEALRPRGRVLVLAHREELLGQAQDKIAHWTALTTGTEQAAQRAPADCDVVIGSVQTMARRLGQWHPEAFGLVIVDEAHHATAPSYLSILSHFHAARRLGVTATPDRLDGAGLGQVFEVVPFIYEIRDAIQDGWLCPIRQRRVTVTSLDLSTVRTTAGDLNEGDLEALLLAERSLHEVAEPLVKLAGTRRTLVFAVTVAHAEALAHVMRRYAPDAHVEMVSSQDATGVRRQAVKDFAAGRTQFLVNCVLLTEGFDLPAIDCVAVVRPTESRALYAQMIGRGTRIAPDKRDLLVLDFRGNAGRHSLVSTFDVLDGTAKADVSERAQELMDESDLSITEAIDVANQELAEQARKRALTVRVQATAVEVNPFTVLGVHVPRGRWGGLAMTDKQRDVLVRNGIPHAGLDRGQASGLIDALIKRRERGACTFKQARTLLKFGLNPDVSFAEASQQISRLAANGWQR